MAWRKPSKAARDDAKAELRAAGFRPDKIVDVDTDAILWVDGARRGHTAWLTRSKDGLMVLDELGFQIERPRQTV